jgi:hypothetical protein
MVEEWAARLSSFIERNEKERAFTEAAKAHFSGEANYSVALDAYRAPHRASEAVTGRGLD